MSIGIRRPRGIRLHQLETLRKRMERRKSQLAVARGKSEPYSALPKTFRSKPAKPGKVKEFFGKMFAPFRRAKRGV